MGEEGSPESALRPRDIALGADPGVVFAANEVGVGLGVAAVRRVADLPARACGARARCTVVRTDPSIRPVSLIRVMRPNSVAVLCRASCSCVVHTHEGACTEGAFRLGRRGRDRLIRVIIRLLGRYLHLIRVIFIRVFDIWVKRAFCIPNSFTHTQSPAWQAVLCVLGLLAGLTNQRQSVGHLVDAVEEAAQGYYGESIAVSLQGHRASTCVGRAVEKVMRAMKAMRGVLLLCLSFMIEVGVEKNS